MGAVPPNDIDIQAARVIAGRSRPMTMRVMGHRPSVIALLSWAILVTAIVVSLRPASPVIWGDTPRFVESALRTLEAGRPTVVNGRDPGYPMFMALTFAFGGDLGSVVFMQEAAWVVLVVTLAATAQTVTRSAWALVPIILVVVYPGLLIYRNVITAESLYSVFLNLAVLGLLLAASFKNPVRCWIAAAAVLIAPAAACFKSQGLLVSILVIPLGALVACPDTRGRRALTVVSCVTALALVAMGSRVGASPADRASVVFVEKTLFCNQLNIVLASETARREIAVAAGDRAGVVLARLAADLDSKRGSWPVLGFYGDECLYDTVLDDDLTIDGSSSPLDVAGAYRRIFLAAILEHPMLYIGKIARQMLHGVLFAWPPYGLEPTIPVSSDDIVHVADVLKQHGMSDRAIVTPRAEIRGFMLSRLGPASTWIFAALSAGFVIALVSSIAIAAIGRRPEFSARAGIVIVMWGTSILTSAAAHTLDVERYLVPSTPMVGLLLSMVCVELGRHRFRASPQGLTPFN